MGPYWNSSYSEMASKFNCAKTSKHDINTNLFTPQVMVASYSMLFYLVLLVLSILGVRFQPCVKILNSQGFALFLIGAPMVFVNIFFNSNNLVVKICFRLASGSLVGILFLAAGAIWFFSKPEKAPNQSTLEQQQPSMGLVVLTITIFLFVVEVALVVAVNVLPKIDGYWESSHKVWSLVLSDKITFLVQKIIQAFFYIGLRRKTFCPVYKENAQFYFKVLSFYNLMEWVDSQVNEESDVQLSGAELIYGPWFDIPIIFYKALITDYRLLCSLLFLEHSLEDGVAKNSRGWTARSITPDPQYSYALCIIGVTCLFAPMFCFLYYKTVMPAWVHVFSIIVNLGIIVLGATFLGKNNLEAEEEDTKSSGVKIMVCCLATVGFTCWMVKATISGYWADTAHDKADIDDQSYFAWVTPKFATRGITTAFLMVLFLKVDAQNTAQRNPDVKLNHFLVPAIIMTTIATFVECLIDQYVGPLDNRLRCEIKDLSLRVLFDAGPPMYLGFIIHVCLHFVIIQAKLAKQSGDGLSRNNATHYGAVENNAFCVDS